jgi:site-specific recombinase XerD
MLCRKYKKLVKNFHWHRLRHTFATNLVRNWVDIYTISQLMGHSDISTTTIYLSLDLMKKTEQINKLQFDISD